MTLAPGTVFAGFTIVRTLGIGGMGTVYLARHPRLPRVEALKLLRPDLSHDAAFTERFAREADIIARLDHPNIVGVNDRGSEDGQLWISMPYIDGVDAEQALTDNRGPLPAERAVRIIVRVGAALDFAHRNGLWHRDVKPANILLAAGHDDEPERVWLTDFGIAKAADDEGRGLTRTGNVIATFEYASPEQIEGRPVDHRVDIYALGGVLYKLLTGSVPFAANTMAATLYGHLNRPPPRPTEQTPWLAPGLDEVIARAMAKDAHARYPTCGAFALAAQAALRALPPPPPLPYSFTATREEPGTGRSLALGPVDTNDLSATDREHLVGLVRQSRLFDLPAHLPSPISAGSSTEPPGDEITIAVRTGTRTGTVSYLAASSRRPEELDELLSRLEDRVGWQPVVVGAGQPLDRRPAAPTEYVHRPEVFPPYIPAPIQPPPSPSTGAPPGQPPSGQPPSSQPPSPTAPRPSRRRLVAALAAALLVIGAGVTAFLLTRDDGRDDEGGSAANSSDLGLPSGPPLPRTVLIAAHESDGNIDLFTVDSATGATLTQLTSAAARDTQATISPDRRSVIYLSREDVAQLWVVGSDGSGARRLFEEQPAGCNQIRGRAAWNPVDPSMLAVVCLDGDGSFTLQLLTPSGEAIRTLDTGLPSLGGPSFSPDGTSLVYWGNGESDANAGALYRMPADGSTAPVQLTDPADVGPGESPTWSPDGSRIAFHVILNADRTDTEVVVMNADGSDPVQLAPSDGIDQDPAWSPDGLLIAFKSDRPDGAGVRDLRLWIMNSDGSGARLVTTDSVLDGFDPAW